MAYVNDARYYVWRGDDESEDYLFFKLKEEQENFKIPMSLFDELVVMRTAQLTENMMLNKVQKRTLKKHSNLHGVDALVKIFGKPTVIINKKNVY